MINSVEDVCQTEHLASMSFHGQASDKAIHKLAAHIATWEGECEEVRIAYFGDHDPEGLTIDGGIFDTSEQYPEGKLREMQKKFFPASPEAISERIGITTDDLNDPDYQQYTLPL